MCGSIKKAPNDYDFRAGQTVNPIPETPTVPVHVLHCLLSRAIYTQKNQSLLQDYYFTVLFS